MNTLFTALTVITTAVSVLFLVGFILALYLIVIHIMTDDDDEGGYGV